MLIIGGGKIRKTLSELAKQISDSRKSLDKCRKEIAFLQEQVAVQQRSIAAMQEALNSKTEKEHEEKKGGNASGDVARKGYFDLNRSDVFVALSEEKTAKSAFSVHPAGEKGCVEFEICNLPRIASYDGIGEAVAFEAGSCPLSVADKCRTVENGLARMGSDGFWHIERRVKVLLYE